MTPEEAVKVAGLIADLWPRPELTGRRLAFYATALTGIPTMDAGVRAVNDLFVSERFQPTPGDVIDSALDVDGSADDQWQRVVAAASDIAARRKVGVMPDPVALAVVRRLCGSLSDVPVQYRGDREKVRAEFLPAYRKAARAAATAVASDGRLELAEGS